MTILSTSSTTDSGYTTSSSASTDQVTNPDSDLTENDFLEMLITKLENQDPLSVSDEDFTSEMAQFSSLEQETTTNSSLSTMSDSLSNMETYLTASVTQNSTSQAVSMVGKTVTEQTTDSSGNVTDTETGTGTVTSVKFESGVAKIVINGVEYSLSTVTQGYPNFKCISCCLPVLFQPV
jgi:flagellar basal-body rod modification protein FlgD